MLDVRKPIGYLFTIYGAILIAWGLIHPVGTPIEGAIDGKNIAINLDLIWGVLMALFGFVMLALAFMERRAHKS